jgi:hypothetical protein
MMTDIKKLRDSDLVDSSLCQQLNGSLMYLENTQPYIFFAMKIVPGGTYP